VAVDADFGGANLNAVFGSKQPDATIKDFLEARTDSLESLLFTPTPLENLFLISGAPGSYGQANLPYGQKLKLIRHLRRLDANFVVLDLGAGSHFNVLDLFLAADMALVLVNPDPLSILEGYDFVRHCLFRKLAVGLRKHKEAAAVLSAQGRIETYRSAEPFETQRKAIADKDPAAGECVDALQRSFAPSLLINKLMDPADVAECLAVQVAAQELLGVNMDYVGCVHFDETVLRSVREGIPFLTFDAKSYASRDMAELVITKIVYCKRIQALFDRQTLRQTLREKWGDERRTVMCTVQCLYWEECPYKEGGFPCKLQHLAGIGGFQT
jgi:flagellar biosynthesis protein FlhG